MPNRILRDFTNSEKVDQLSPEAENLFVRLMMQADDFGSFYANPKLIKSACFPLKEWTAPTIERLVSELANSGLILLYEVEGKNYLRIVDFGQRLRSMKNGFPNPSNNEEVIENFNNSPRVADNSLTTRRNSPPETKRSRNEVETETKMKQKEKGDKSPKNSPSQLFRESVFFDKEKFIAELESSPPPYCNANGEHYYEAALNWSDSNAKKKVDWIATVKNWIRRAVEEGTFKTKFSQPTPIQQNGNFKDKSQRVADHNADQLKRLVGGAEGS